MQVRVEGAGPILAHLDTKLSMLGSSPLQRALVRQWVSFQVGGIHIPHGVFYVVSLKLVDSEMKHRYYSKVCLLDNPIRPNSIQ